MKRTIINKRGRIWPILNSNFRQTKNGQLVDRISQRDLVRHREKEKEKDIARSGTDRHRTSVAMEKLAYRKVGKGS